MLLMLLMESSYIYNIVFNELINTIFKAIILCNDDYRCMITKIYPGPSWGLHPGLLLKLLLGEGSWMASGTLGDRISVLRFLSFGISNWFEHRLLTRGLSSLSNVILLSRSFLSWKKGNQAKNSYWSEAVYLMMKLLYSDFAHKKTYVSISRQNFR